MYLEHRKEEPGKLGVVPIVAASAITAAAQLSLAAINYWKQQSYNNAMKVKATTEAEGFVKIFYGATSANCEIKTGNQAVWQYGQPQQYLNSITSLPVTSPKFCEATVAGLLERCRIGEAYSLLQSATQDAKSLAQGFAWFAPWYYQYGMQDISFLNAKCNSFAQLCAGSGIDLVTGQPLTTGGSGNTSGSSGTVSPSAQNTVMGIPLNTLLLVGVGGLLVYTMVSD